LLLLLPSEKKGRNLKNVSQTVSPQKVYTPTGRRFTKRTLVNAFVGFIVGLGGGLVGLGGAELRLPYLAGSLRLPVKTAIPINLTISLLTILAALPARLYALSITGLKPFIYETAALGFGAALGSYGGVSWLRRISQRALARSVFVLLLALGTVMLAESVVTFTPHDLISRMLIPRLLSGLCLGSLIGAISGLLGVAGGEMIIPTLILGFGAPIKAGGSLSQMVSIPTVLTGFVRHYRAGALKDQKLIRDLIFPMGLGAIVGAILGGTLSSRAPSGFLKALLGVILIGSSLKTFARRKTVATVVTSD
jgi:uncharacterized protein